MTEVPGETAWQQQYRAEARRLAELGRHLAEQQLPPVEVRLPRDLAEAAVAAWEREGDTGPLAPESFEQATMRGRAAALSLIGLSIKNAGSWNGDEMVVSLSPVFIGAAAEAAEGPSGE